MTIYPWFRGGVLAVLLAAAPALAQNQNDRGSRGHNNNNNRGTRAVSAPEFDPAVAGAIGAIVAGGGVLLARRRRR